MLASIAVLSAAFALTPGAGPIRQSDAIVWMLNSPSCQSPERYEAAVARVAADAAAGMPLQRYMLAVLAGSEDLPPVARLDEATRTEYLETTRDRIRSFAETRNNPLAWYLLSMENNDIDFLKRAVDGGNVQALNAYGTYLIDKALASGMSDTNAVASLMAESFSCFSRAAERGDANGLYNLGLCRMRGIGCPRDAKLAVASLRAAAKAGHPDAMDDLAMCYERGEGVERSESTSMVWTMRARALRGDRAAARWLESSAYPKDD